MNEPSGIYKLKYLKRSFFFIFYYQLKVNKKEKKKQFSSKQSFSYLCRVFSRVEGKSHLNVSYQLVPIKFLCVFPFAFEQRILFAVAGRLNCLVIVLYASLEFLSVYTGRSISIDKYFLSKDNPKRHLFINFN